MVLGIFAVFKYRKKYGVDITSGANDRRIHFCTPSTRETPYLGVMSQVEGYVGVCDVFSKTLKRLIRISLFAGKNFVRYPFIEQLSQVL